MGGKLICVYFSPRIFFQDPKVVMLLGMCYIADLHLGWLVVSWDGYAFSVISQVVFQGL